ncbi:hypothetical protein LTR17_021933 [Elasticomyces elasticus]|nr:hypothetical protein LTR17_021933 [Elasticomyces elasticus]
MTSRSSDASKKSSLLPASKPTCTIHSTAIVSEKAQFTGSHAVNIGEGAVIHPHARIRAEGGNVTIGKHSMLYERALVGTVDGEDVTIGDYVNIETGAVVEAKSVGDGTTVEVNAVVGKGAVLGRWCKIAPLERVAAGEVLEDFTVVYGDGQRRIDKTTKKHKEVRDLKKEAQVKAVQVISTMIPNFSAKWEN